MNELREPKKNINVVNLSDAINRVFKNMGKYGRNYDAQKRIDKLQQWHDLEMKKLKALSS